MKRQKWREIPGQTVLDFPFWEEERIAQEAERKKQEEERKEKIKALKRYEEPVNDNQKLFNLQAEFYQEGKQTALENMFLILNKAAEKLVRKECKEKTLFLTSQRKHEIALDAAVMVIEQINKNELIVENSFIAYLYLQLRKVMYNRTKAKKLEDYSIEQNKNFLELSDDERQSLKAEFEGKKNERKDSCMDGGTQLLLVDWCVSYDRIVLSFDGIHYNEYQGDELKFVVIKPDGETEVMSFNKIHKLWGFTPKQIEYAVQTGSPICNIYFDELPEKQVQGLNSK